MEHHAGGWFEEVREHTARLVGVCSVSPGSGETEAAREALRLLHADGLEEVYAESGLDPLEGDPYGRANAYAILRGRSPHAVVLMGHIDTVQTADYGPLEPWALDPEGLEARQEELMALAPDLADDLTAQSGDWMFGRGVADMKSGVAAAIAVVRRLAADARTAPPPLSVVLLAVVDEENESAGILQGVRLLLRLRERHGLTYAGAINTDYTTARYPGDPCRYIYTGTVGKLLPGFLAVGRASHAGAPFDGLDANLIIAELVRDVSMNERLCDTVRDEITPPPVTLHAADLKTQYDTQLPTAAAAYVNVLTLTTGPGELLERLRPLAAASLARVLERVAAAERRWRNDGPNPVHDTRLDPRAGAVLTYAELRAATAERLGEERVADALTQEGERLPASLDRRERSLHLMRRLWSLSGRQGPAIVLYYAPPYYPHVASSRCALHDTIAAVVAAHPDLCLAQQTYFPLISDLSYLRLDPAVDLAALQANMPVWQEPDAPPRAGSYSLPLAAIGALDLPVANLGPYGRGAHQPGERVLMSYSFETLPRLIYETLHRLAGLVTADLRPEE